MRKLPAIEGFFFSEGVKRLVHHGTLSYTPTRGVRLRVYGQFRENDDYENRGETVHSTVHGDLENGEHVRLYNCRGFEDVGLGRIPITEYSAEFALHGYCKLAIDEQRIVRARVKVRHLKDWLNIPRWQSVWQPNEGPGERKYNVGLQGLYPSLPTLFECSDFTMKVHYESTAPWGKVVHVKGAIKESAYIEFQYHKYTDLRSFTRHVNQLERFLCIVSQEDMIITGMSVRVHKPELDAQPDTPQKSDALSTFHRLYYGYYPEMKRERIRHHDLFLSHGAIKSDLQGAYTRWLEVYDSISPSLDQLLEHRLNSLGYETTKHAYYSFVFEALNARLVPSTPAFDPTAFMQMRDQLLGSVPAEYRNYLAGKIDIHQSPSLRNRYRSVLQHFLNGTSDFTKEKIEHYAKRLVASRNMISHEGKFNESNPINFNNVVQYNELLLMLIAFMLLDACGLERKALVRRLLNARQFSYIHGAKDM